MYGWLGVRNATDLLCDFRYLGSMGIRGGNISKQKKQNKISVREDFSYV